MRRRRRRHVASFQHPEVSGGKPMIAVVEEFPPVQHSDFLGFILFRFFSSQPTSLSHCCLAVAPSPMCTKGCGLSGSDWVAVQEYVSTSSQKGHSPELKLKQGKQQSLGLSSSVKTATSSSGQGKAESWHRVKNIFFFIIGNSKIISSSYGAPWEIAMEQWYPAFILIFLAQSLIMC